MVPQLPSVVPMPRVIASGCSVALPGTSTVAQATSSSVPKSRNKSPRSLSANNLWNPDLCQCDPSLGPAHASVNSLLHGLVISDVPIPIISLDLSPSGYFRWHGRVGSGSRSVCSGGYRQGSRLRGWVGYINNRRLGHLCRLRSWSWSRK